MQSINGFHFDDRFCHFLTRELLPQSATTADFWDRFTSLIDSASELTAVAVPPRTDEVSLLQPRYVLKAVNARWGSLYNALYHEDAIPHTAGLRTGQQFNVARASRVIDYARQFLDAAFPLAEGSHKDAVSYLIYYQNLMVTLADGSTVGLKHPSQYIAKAGPKENLQSLLLQNADLSVELRFNRCGTNGASDMAAIDDILIEAPARATVGSHAENVEDKCTVWRNMLSLTSGTLSAQFMRDGKSRTRRLHRDAEFTARDGETHLVKSRNPVALHLRAGSTCAAVRDVNDNALPEAVVDAALFAMLTNNYTQAEFEVVASSREVHEMLQPLADKLQNEGLHPNQFILVKGYRDHAPAEAVATDTPVTQPAPSHIAREANQNATIAMQHNAVLNAIQHNYLPH
jgi:hypothetical protein